MGDDAKVVPGGGGGDGRGRDGDDGRRVALARAIVRTVGRAIAEPGRLTLDLDDGARSPGPIDPSRRSATRVVIRGPDAVARMLFPPSPHALAEAYLRGDLDIVGDVRTAVDAGDAVDVRRLRPADLRRVARWGLELRQESPAAPPLRRYAHLAGRRHSRARDLEAVRFHYDVGNAFFGLWLDRRLTYSCAYFDEGATAAEATDLLDAAQEAKLDRIAHKLRVGPGSRVLDIGCGWGSLIGFLAERHGATATGVTLSQRQADEANARLSRAGLAGRASAIVLDYRDLAGLGTFDAVASVGMFEHVGLVNLPRYFRAAFDALRPGGLFLNHGIAQAGAQAGRRRAGQPRIDPFIDRFVFPDGELVPIDTAVRSAREAGFEVLDVQSLRPHYALTLAAWVARLEGRWEEAVAAGGEEVARTWRLYMSASRLGFERGGVDVFQLLLARPEGPSSPASRPLRPWW